MTRDLDLKNMKVRKEFANEIIDSMGALGTKAETNGEFALLYTMMKAMRENLQWEEEK